MVYGRDVSNAIRAMGINAVKAGLEMISFPQPSMSAMYMTSLISVRVEAFQAE